jgi:hypothetical protein
MGSVFPSNILRLHLQRVFHVSIIIHLSRISKRLLQLISTYFYIVSIFNNCPTRTEPRKSSILNYDIAAEIIQFNERIKLEQEVLKC